MPRNVLILGAAGRDFHNFLSFFRARREYRVVGFTAEQIPGIAGRVFPASLAGRRYPNGIPIYAESDLPKLVKKLEVDDVCLAYSDLSDRELHEKASLALANGANFLLLGPEDTYIDARVPVVAVTAVRTGCGKSQTARALGEVFRRRGQRPVAIRHSMPYGDLAKQVCQRFRTTADFDRHETTIEEEEEYQPWLDHGFPIYSGFDYRAIVRRAERDGDVLIFDGGNNDVPMIRPDFMVTVVDPHRAGHETAYYPGFVNLLLADAVVVNKVDSAAPENVNAVARAVRRCNPRATVIRARSDIIVEHPERLRGKRCVVVGDGPTLTHGGASFGAGTLAVKKHGGVIVDPRDWLAGSMRATYRKYPHLECELPAMGYSPRQIRDLETILNRVDCDLIVDGTPADLRRLMKLRRPIVEVDYELGARAVRRLERELEASGLLGAKPNA